MYATNRVYTHQHPSAGIMQRLNVGPVIDLMGRNPVRVTMTREKDNRLIT